MNRVSAIAKVFENKTDKDHRWNQVNSENGHQNDYIMWV